MYLPDYDYYTPDSVEAVSKMLAERPGAMILSGGTDLIIKMKMGVLAPETLISLKRVSGLDKIEYVAGKGIAIGGCVTHNGLVKSDVLKEKFKSVCNAAKSMAANQVRNAGTIAGNIVSAVPSADLPPILIALNATVTLVSAKGSRTLPIEDVFTGPGKTVLEKDEVLTEIVIPDQDMTGSSYSKYGLRKAGALATIGVAVALKMKGNVIEDIRIAFGAVAPVPMRAKKVEEFLKGKEATDENLQAAADIAHDECKPISDHRASEEYRRAMVGVYTKRAIKKVIAEGHN